MLYVVNLFGKAVFKASIAPPTLCYLVAIEEENPTEWFIIKTYGVFFNASFSSAKI